MAKRHSMDPICGTDLDRLIGELYSPDEVTRAAAVRQICPCRMGWAGFERGLDAVRRLQKDSSPAVRAAARHVMEEAYELESGGLPTSRQEVKNEMAARKRRLRMSRDD